MTKKEYAQKVAQIVNGEVKEVEKANGAILTGVILDNGSNLRPTVYIDSMMDEELTIDEAAEQVNRIARTHALESRNMDFILDYESIKPMLRARLYNKATTADVYKEAGNGFDDLVIIPYIEGVIENGSCKVTAGMLTGWNKTADEVISDAMKNSDKEANVKTMHDIMADMGFEVPDDPNMLVVSNTRKAFGAYAVLSKLPILKTLFPDGFTVLPSSVHEVIVVPLDDKAALDSMVQEVNDEQVDFTEQLSNHAYRIAA